MKLLLPLIMILAFPVRSADQKDEDLATIVIQSEIHTGYNPLNSADEELNRAAVFNAGLSLQYIMLREVTDPELKVCYALRVLDSQIATFRLLASESNKAAAENLTVLLRRQSELGKQLRAIQNRKADGVGPSDRTQPVRPETSGLPANVVTILDRLNAWNKDAIDVCERPAAHSNMVDSGETSAFINVEKQQLAALGVAVKWNPQKMMYEVAAADEPLIPTSLNALLPKIASGMTHDDTKKVLSAAYPNLETQVGPWSGQSGYMGFHLDEQFSVMFSAHMDTNQHTVVSSNAMVLVFDRAQKLRLEITHYYWDDKAPQQ